jgi:hypothetical protein
MNRWYFALLIYSSWLASGSGFVAIQDSAGRLPHWNLVNPAPQPGDPAIVTNIVNPVTKAVRYFISAEAYSTTNRQAELNCVRACFDQWQAIPGTLLKFEEGGLISGLKDVDYYDYTNMVFWAKTSTTINGGYDNISGALGLAIYSYYDDNTVAECDIVMNGVQYRWTTTPVDNGDSSAYYIEPILLHEIGHLIGLDHSPVGGATMMARGESGEGLGTGLTTDEISAARTLYARSDWAAKLGTITGKVTLSGAGAFGAVVTAEDSAGNLVSGTVTRAGGLYDLPALLPGAYQVRVSPLDPVNASTRLLSGVDISTSVYATAQTGFAPSAPISVTIAGGQTATANFTLTAGNPAFRITLLRPPTTDPNNYETFNAPSSLLPGQSNWIIGVYSSDLPASGATLTVTGDGITVGITKFYPSITSSLNLIWTTVSVASNATPGLRTLVVQRGSDIAYANGFLVIPTPTPDANYDGLNDQFQRQYFSLFTAPEAGPNSDPDHDGFNNLAEYIAGTNPTNATSFLRLDRLQGSNPAQLEWAGAAGRIYQIDYRDSLLSVTWQPLATRVLGTGPTNRWQDTQATQSQRFYRLLAIP